MGNQKTDINDVAAYFINFGQECGEPPTPLKLQKLCYYAEAYHWAVYGEPLTGVEFQAWAHGPVCVSLWSRFCGYKWNQITEEITMPKLAQGVLDFLDEVAGVFYQYSAYQLERMTHSDQPWISARGDCEPAERCETPIKTEDMRNFYRQYVQEA